MTNEGILRTVIVDDEETAIDNLCFELKRYGWIQVVGIAKNGVAGIRLIEKERPDLLFLDVELPDMTGMDVAGRIHDAVDWKMQVVFYTAYNKYLIDALRNYAFDFMLKPVDPKELEVVLNRIQSVASGNGEPVGPLKPTPLNEKSFMVVVPTGDLRILRVSDIGYFRYLSGRKIWEAALSNGTFIPLRRNTTAENLCAYDSSFVQVHQSFIINMNYLIMVQDNRCIMYPPFDGADELQVSKKYRKKLMDRFCQL